MPDQQELFPELCTLPALLVLLMVAELLAIILVLAGSDPSWSRFALVSLFVQWNVLGGAALLCALRRPLARLGLNRGGIVSFALMVALVAVVSVAAQLLLPEAYGHAGGIDPVQVARNCLIGAILAGLLMRYLYVQQRLRAQEQSELQSRIQALQSRIRPHFLFNSMNIIASLIATEPETAETVVEDLSELFRASLNEAGNQVPLQEELDLCERYVRIETLRLGERLHVEWQIDPSLRNGVQIPLLTLQPLLENAIYHGIQPLPEGGIIEVSLGWADGLVDVMIRNPVPSEDDRAGRHTAGNRMAVQNIRSRLTVMFGDRAHLEGGLEGGHYVTRLHYPHDIYGGADGSAGQQGSTQRTGTS